MAPPQLNSRAIMCIPTQVHDGPVQETLDWLQPPWQVAYSSNVVATANRSSPAPARHAPVQEHTWLHGCQFEVVPSTLKKGKFTE